MYFNTTHLRGQQLAEYEIKAERQENLIAEFFRHNPLVEVTTEDLWNWIPDLKSCPLTSVRRAFSNLQDDGLIYKTDNQIDGSYGRPIYTWKKAIMRQAALL